MSCDFAMKFKNVVVYQLTCLQSSNLMKSVFCELFMNDGNQNPYPYQPNTTSFILFLFLYLSFQHYSILLKQKLLIIYSKI